MMTTSLDRATEPGREAAPYPGGMDGQAVVRRGGVAAAFSPVPVPGCPAGSSLPGVQAVAARGDGRVVAVTRTACAVPGKPDGEADTRPLRPVWMSAGTGSSPLPWETPEVR